MTPEEMAKYRVLAEQLRRARRMMEQLQRENAALKAECETLRKQQSVESRAFDMESKDIFEVIHRNHALSDRKTRVEVFYPCMK